MKTISEVKVSNELQDRTSLTDERIFRDLACTLVRDMPLEELHKLICLTKIDPDSAESKEILINVEQLNQLKRERLTLYQAKVDIS